MFEGVGAVVGVCNVDAGTAVEVDGDGVAADGLVAGLVVVGGNRRLRMMFNSLAGELGSKETATAAFARSVLIWAVVAVG